MSPTYFIPIFLVLLVIFTSEKKQNNMVIKRLLNRKSPEDKINMIELAKEFIDKECLIYTFNGTQITGTIKEVGASALLLENKGTVEAINIDFVMRIREYPRNKNGKKKSIILD